MNDLSPYQVDLSYVIIGKNAEWSIARLLDSVITCTPPQLKSEIIYVDSASTDRTISIVRQYPARTVQLSADQPLCASAGRFIGSQYATGRYVVFLDSDMELIKGWLESAVSTLDKCPDVAAISGVIVDAERTAKFCAVDKSLYCDGAIRDIRYAGNAAMFRHDVLDAVGNWNPYLISDEEPELCLRIRHAGFRIAELPHPISCHYTYPTTEISTLFSRRKRRLFLGYGQVVRYHLRTGLLATYFRERGWAIPPALACLTAICALVISGITRNDFWILGYCGATLLVLAADAVRSRSLYGVIFHVLHRALILEGTIKGFAMHPHSSDEYPRSVQLLEPFACSPMNADIPA